ncbi:GntR family transcriptional regulator [Agrococcus sp. ARC_14]|uniref:GntR family transcriptional regulator n=1 Tax=Agrococcus sp. ARC_14 TaxID=2919927 RepID=UPI001F050C47|nr:GntR family transcriptional regulator [Agrococcus sp. ARC_14]MCH1881933.1 GntR family transcriptional regulator [Agrococcus sp. ARC_14]
MSTPRYLQIRANLEAQIASGELAPGAKLPTEAELQEQHGVSRSVAQRVLNELALAGLVTRRKRVGTHVAEGARQINVMRSVDPRIGATEIPGRMRVVSASVMPAGKAHAELPGVDTNEPVIELIRVRHDVQTDEPLVVEIAVLPFRLTPELLDEALEDVSVRQYFADQGVAIARSRMYFDPVLLEGPIASLLDIEPGICVLKRRRMMWQSDGRIAESAAYYLRPGAMEFYIEYSDPESQPS